MTFENIRLLNLAIKSLKPNSEYSFDDNDYSSIKWNSLEGDAPTESEIMNAIDKIKNDEKTFILEKAKQKTALLKRLEMTEDEAKLLFG